MDVGDYFVEIPIAQRYGGLKVPVKTHTRIPEGSESIESKLYR
ncbi:MAG: hypothetical protein BTN85_1353 [Candidatus Methanohalarchaeum thermophilum]|uniref:Uncharacterized protein n=1 Tax=Methanohalarchaeum thermophilum TaxID=1903181 RepID=A0A1Q6DWV3_METT1|nr:MAG: hypothetical protein BTN85_1353 [Candidatus Methanohalarchaeum thermophilum]